MKSKIFIGVFLLIILIANLSFASYSTVTMSVVEEPVCSIELSENSKFEKRLISKDLSNKEVTIQLQVTNDEGTIKPEGEMVFVLDNSDSMLEEFDNGSTRKDVIFESAKTLISSLLKDNDNLKIGIVSFSANIDSSKEGTSEDASIVSNLSTDSTALSNAITKIEATGPRTNLDSGLALADTLFTDSENNKYLIVLTDGIPNIAIDYDKTYYSDDVINKTKSRFQSLDDKNIKIITMLTGINPEDESRVPPGVTKSYGEITEEIFGTSTNPNFGTFYYVSDNNIEKTITEDIYNELLPIAKSFKDFTIKDYFPAEIVKNFDFSYVSKANVGNISTEIDTTNNSITWTIPELQNGQTATVEYKLKLKENFDSSIVDKLLNTNQKVDITYIDFNEEQQSETSNISPKIKLTEPPVVLPKAGTITFWGFVAFAIGLLMFSSIKLISLYKEMN